MAASLVANTLETLARRSRLKIGIDLADQPTGFVASYTTRDKIEGEVTIEADQDTRFDSVEITFEGMPLSVIYFAFASLLPFRHLENNRRTTSNTRLSSKPAQRVPDLPQASPAHRRDLVSGTTSV